MVCDVVENQGKRIMKSCYLLHESCEEENIQKQLLTFAMYAEKWRPVFTAGGFYDINRTCLATIFTSIMTYLVIIFQFELAVTN